MNIIIPNYEILNFETRKSSGFRYWDFKNPFSAIVKGASETKAFEGDDEGRVG